MNYRTIVVARLRPIARPANNSRIRFGRIVLAIGALLITLPDTLLGQPQAERSSPPQDRRVNVTAYASAGSGSNEDPWVDALRNALEAKGGGTTYYLPTGTYKDTSTLWIKHNEVKIVGDGGASTIATTILYDETDGSTCWKFAPPPDEENKRNYIGGITVKGICFRGRGKPTGSAIEIESLNQRVGDLRAGPVGDWPRPDGVPEDFPLAVER